MRTVEAHKKTRLYGDSAMPLGRINLARGMTNSESGPARQGPGSTGPLARSRHDPGTSHACPLPGPPRTPWMAARLSELDCASLSEARLENTRLVGQGANTGLTTRQKRAPAKRQGSSDDRSDSGLTVHHELGRELINTRAATASNSWSVNSRMGFTPRLSVQTASRRGLTALR